MNRDNRPTSSKKVIFRGKEQAANLSGKRPVAGVVSGRGKDDDSSGKTALIVSIIAALCVFFLVVAVNAQRQGLFSNPQSRRMTGKETSSRSSTPRPYVPENERIRRIYAMDLKAEMAAQGQSQEYLARQSRMEGYRQNKAGLKQDGPVTNPAPPEMSGATQ